MQTEVPRAPEEFFNRHNNKVAIVDHYKFKQYKFFTVLNAFTTHNWHKRGADNGPEGKPHQEVMDSILYDLRGQYSSTEGTDPLTGSLYESGYLAP
jgi:hypothetical protein